jgi:putative FmdB family regulatory protein
MMPQLMPIYEYRCENDHRFEAFQAMADDPLDACEVCGATAQRVLSAPAVHFKGSGFYTTDYARKGAKKAATDGGSSSEKDSSEKSSDSGTDKSSEKSSSSSSGSGD